MTKQHKNKHTKERQPDFHTSLHVNEAEWNIRVQYTKGALSKGRGVVVTVTHIKSGRYLRASSRATTNADCRRVALSLARELIAELLR